MIMSTVHVVVVVEDLGSFSGCAYHVDLAWDARQSLIICTMFCSACQFLLTSWMVTGGIHRLVSGLGATRMKEILEPFSLPLSY
jgi:hypothetical protein